MKKINLMIFKYFFSDAPSHLWDFVQMPMVDLSTASTTVAQQQRPPMVAVQRQQRPTTQFVTQVHFEEN